MPYTTDCWLQQSQPEKNLYATVLQPGRNKDASTLWGMRMCQETWKWICLLRANQKYERLAVYTFRWSLITLLRTQRAIGKQAYIYEPVFLHKMRRAYLGRKTVFDLNYKELMQKDITQKLANLLSQKLEDYQ